MSKTVGALRDDNLYLKESLVGEPEFCDLKNYCNNMARDLNCLMNMERNRNLLPPPSLNSTATSLPLQLQSKTTLNNTPATATRNSPAFKTNSPRHQEYRDIINDLTNELSELSTQFKNEFDKNGMSMPFESNLRVLETQNDLLQTNIESLVKKNAQYDTALKNRELKEEQYKIKIASLEQEIQLSSSKYNTLFRNHQSLLYDVKQFKERCKCGAVKAVEIDEQDNLVAPGRKSQDLQHIFEMMERKDDELKVLKEFSANEKSRMNKRLMDMEDQIKTYEVNIAVLKNGMEKKDLELRDIRKKIAVKDDDTHFKDLIETLTSELADEKAQRKERETLLEADLKNIRAALDETRASLVKANESVACLEAQSVGYQRQGETANKENSMLQAEVFNLKGNIATLEGTERSLKTQLSKTQDEVVSLRASNIKIKTLTEDLDIFKQNCVRLKNTNYDLIKQYNTLIEDYNCLADEYKKISDLKDSIERELEMTRKWQQEQGDQDKVTKNLINQMNEHIQTLSDDRGALLNKIHEYHRDFLIVSDELDNYKEIFADTMGEAQDRASLAAGEMPGQDTADAMIRKILRIADKLSHTRKTFQESFDRRNSKI